MREIRSLLFTLGDRGGGRELPRSEDRLLTLHRRLDQEIRRGDGTFVSGWRAGGQHPYANDYLPLAETVATLNRDDVESYSFLSNSS